MVLSKKMVERVFVAYEVGARVVEACGDNSVLYDCHLRIWYNKESKEMQKRTYTCEQE